jgi:drug/metabolite transporter (DMT)-like permease
LLLSFSVLSPGKRERVNRVNLNIALAYSSTVILLVVATKATTAANAIILQYTAAAFVFFLAIPLLKEYPQRKDWWVLGATMAGVACIFSRAEEAGFWGVSCGLASGWSFAILTILLRRYKDKEPLFIISVNNFCVALILLPWVYIELWLSPRDLILMVVMGVVQLGSPYVLCAHALRRVQARDAVLISLLEPLLNPIWVYLAVAEMPADRTILGGAIILAGLCFRYGLLGGWRIGDGADRS